MTDFAALRRPSSSRADIRLSRILIHCNSKWEPVLSDYRRAMSLKDRKAAALFALMRFASTEPDVREGNYRVDGFAAYSYYRDNWWCFTIPPTERGQNSWRDQYNDDTGWGFTSLAHLDVPDPVFLGPTDRAEAAREIATLQAESLRLSSHRSLCVADSTSQRSQGSRTARPGIPGGSQCLWR